MADGRLYIGSMPNGVKAKDLQRDPRCCIITPLADKEDVGGEARQRGQADVLRLVHGLEAVAEVVARVMRQESGRSAYVTHLGAGEFYCS